MQAHINLLQDICDGYCCEQKVLIKIFCTKHSYTKKFKLEVCNSAKQRSRGSSEARRKMSKNIVFLQAGTERKQIKKDCRNYSIIIIICTCEQINNP